MSKVQINLILPPNSLSSSSQHEEVVPEKPVCLDDFEKLAKKKLSKMAWDYYSSGSMDEITLKDNRNAWNDIRLLPRYGKDVRRESLDTTVKLFGKSFKVPFGSAPTAMHRLAHDEGEVATGKACMKKGALMCLSTFSTCSMEDVKDGMKDGNSIWQQLYLLRGDDRKRSKDLIERAEKLGFGAIVVTIDTAQLGKRLHNEREQMILPKGIHHANFDEAVFQGKALPPDHECLDWDLTIPWIRNVTKLPVLLKGILSVDDAIKACQVGVDGIVVSNHGGRQLDGVPATCQVLGDVCKAVRQWERENGHWGKMVIVVDGGIHRGTDVLKALALGADYCFVGRPILYSLAWNGQSGVEQCLDLLEQELINAMALVGVSRVEEIDEGILYKSSRM